jgi:transcriptional regulator GlxA family with amidase domain
MTEYEIQQIHEAAKLLTRDLRATMTVSELAQKVRLPVRKLQEGFRKEFNKTVYNYLLEERMIKAKEMLLAHRPVKYVARKVGYVGANAETNFIKAFHKRFQVTPMQWTRQQKKVV